MFDYMEEEFIQMATQRFLADEKILESMQKAKEEREKNPLKYHPFSSGESKITPSLEDFFIDELFKTAAKEAEGIMRNPNHYIHPRERKNEYNFLEFIETMEKALRICKKIKGY